jgi:hypothetical protein
MHGRQTAAVLDVGGANLEEALIKIGDPAEIAKGGLRRIELTWDGFFPSPMKNLLESPGRPRLDGATRDLAFSPCVNPLPGLGWTRRRR